MARKAKRLDPDDWLNGGALDDDEVESNAGIIATKSRLAIITGLNVKTLDRAFEQGAPVVAKGNRKQGWQINTADFINWYIRRKVAEVEGEGNGEGVSFDQAKTRKMLADAERSEMANARERGVTITIDEAVALYRQEASVIRSQLMAIPGRCAVLVAAETDPATIEAMILDEINIALSNISGDRPDTWTGESNETRDRREDAEHDSDRDSESAA